jgi:hypothetical protein
MRQIFWLLVLLTGLLSYGTAGGVNAQSGSIWKGEWKANNSPWLLVVETGAYTFNNSATFFDGQSKYSAKVIPDSGQKADLIVESDKYPQSYKLYINASIAAMEMFTRNGSLVATFTKTRGERISPPLPELFQGPSQRPVQTPPVDEFARVTDWIGRWKAVGSSSIIEVHRSGFVTALDATFFDGNRNYSAVLDDAHDGKARLVLKDTGVRVLLELEDLAAGPTISLYKLNVGRFGAVIIRPAAATFVKSSHTYSGAKFEDKRVKEDPESEALRKLNWENQWRAEHGLPGIDPPIAQPSVNDPYQQNHLNYMNNLWRKQPTRYAP